MPVSLEQHAAEAAAHGVPSEVVELLTYLFSEVMDGRNATTTDGVRRALGRDPRDFADYARAAAITGVWNDPAAAACQALGWDGSAMTEVISCSGTSSTSSRS